MGKGAACCCVDVCPPPSSGAATESEREREESGEARLPSREGGQVWSPDSRGEGLWELDPKWPTGEEWEGKGEVFWVVVLVLLLMKEGELNEEAG